jgi:hypothetical protein
MITGRRIANGSTGKGEMPVRNTPLIAHLDADAAVLGDLVDVRLLHEPHANIRVSQTIGGAPVAFAIKLELGAGENTIEQFENLTYCFS